MAVTLWLGEIMAQTGAKLNEITTFHCQEYPVYNIACLPVGRGPKNRRIAWKPRMAGPIRVLPVPYPGTGFNR